MLREEKVRRSKKPPRPQKIQDGQIFMFEHEAADMPLFTGTPCRVPFSPFVQRPAKRETVKQINLFLED